jgi:hypothetical protein
VLVPSLSWQAIVFNTRKRGESVCRTSSRGLVCLQHHLVDILLRRLLLLLLPQVLRHQRRRERGLIHRFRPQVLM